MKKINGILIAIGLFCFFSFTVYAEENNTSESRHQMIQAVLRFHQWANSVYGKPSMQPIKGHELKANLEKIFNPNITHWLNGDMVATSIDDLYKRFSILGHKYDSVRVILPYDEISADTFSKKVTIRYRIIFHMKDGKEKIIYALSMFKVENNRLSEFNEVSTTKLDHLHA